MSARRPHYEQWIAKAIEDEGVAQEILDAKSFPAPACFHAQQMAEKLLKALLVLVGDEYPKTHDLLLLAVHVQRSIPSVKRLRKDLRILNRYYVETRYPGDFPEFTFEEAVAALEAARRVNDFAHAVVTRQRRKDSSKPRRS